MNPLDALQTALQSLRANLMRSILTMLGIIIGVAAVVIMIAIGAGAQASIEGFIQGLGTNILTISPGASRFGGVSSGAGSQRSLTLSDARAIESEIDHVLTIAATVQDTAQVIAGNLNWRTRITGATPGVFEARDWQLAKGRLLNESDMRGGTKVAVIGKTVADKLLVGENVLGTMIRINRVPFRVVGVLKEKGQTAFGTDQDDVVFIPLSTAKKRVIGSGRFAGDRVASITVKVTAADWIGQVEKEVRELLRRRHRLSDSDADDFSIRNLAQVMRTSAQTTRAMSMLLAAIASVSLIVGGIGIMNIMLVSVTERTREIGLRMAVGARRRDIQWQFLIESITLSLAGGVIGVALGASGAIAISRMAGWSTILPPQAAALAFGFSALIGIFFGYYPARQAARLDPIEALRYE